MKLSIVSTLYKSAPYIDEFYDRMVCAAEKIAGNDYEIIFVNDGSPDDSLNIAINKMEESNHIVVINLSRNFGHHAAIVAGLEQSKGEIVFLIDSDLEERPEWLDMFCDKMKETSADVVYGVQETRTGNASSRALGSLFWKSINFMSQIQIPQNPMTCRLMNRNYVDSLLSIGDRVLYLAGVFAWTGYKQVEIPLTKTPRTKGVKSTYNLSRKLMQVVDSFSSFNIAPLIMVFFTGITVWALSILYGIHLLVQKIVDPQMVLSGFTSMMLSIWFLSGSIIVCLGIIGLYISKIFQEVKRRPLYITKEVLRKK